MEKDMETTNALYRLLFVYLDLLGTNSIITGPQKHKSPDTSTWRQSPDFTSGAGHLA